MNNSHAHSRSLNGNASPENSRPAFSVTLPGELNDAETVRTVTTAAMKRSGLSREQIAEHMALTTGTNVTERMLHNFCADSRTDVRFPLELVRAFCAAVQDETLIRVLAELNGLRFCTPEELHLMELGRAFLQQKRATAKMADLEAQLAEVALG